MYMIQGEVQNKSGHKCLQSGKSQPPDSCKEERLEGNLPKITGQGLSACGCHGHPPSSCFSVFPNEHTLFFFFNY